MKGRMIVMLLLLPGAAAGAQTLLAPAPATAGTCEKVNDLPADGAPDGARALVLRLRAAGQSTRDVQVVLDARGRPRWFGDRVQQPAQAARVTIDPETGALSGERLIWRRSLVARSPLNAPALDSARALALEVLRRCGGDDD